MTGLIDTVRALFRGALDEHGQEPPALIGVDIERARRGSDPRLVVHFANGYSASESVSRPDCYEFCTRHAAWDMESLQRALLDEAVGIYEQMREAHLLEARATAQRTERMRIFGEELAQIFQPLRRSAFAEFMGFGRGLGRQRAGDEVGTKQARARGLRLLEDNLTPFQRHQYAKHQYFDVIGGQTGRRYRIRHGRMMNIDQIEDGVRVCGWCFYPRGRLVTGDVMLAQKLALELFEADALRIANRL